MKKVSLLIIVILFCCACSKKGDTPAPNTVTIDGDVYSTINIGNQVWTTQNYHGSGGGVIKATASNAILTGNYYNSVSGITLPAGWRLPTAADFNLLLAKYSEQTDNYGNNVVNQIYTNSFESTEGWTVGLNGTNGIGFNAYPSGQVYPTDQSGLANAGNTSNNGQEAYFLSSSIFDNNANVLYVLTIGNSFYLILNNGYDGYTSLQPRDMGNGFHCSLRFVKDK